MEEADRVSFPCTVSMDARSSIAAGEFDTEVDSGQEVCVAVHHIPNITN